MFSVHPLTNAPFRLWNGMRNAQGQRHVDSDTSILIDGFQGSANTFATRVFRSVQDETKVTISHHGHAPEQVHAAVRLGKPTLVMIREPVGAVRSTLRRWPGVDPRIALRGYSRYYRAIQPVIDSIHLATFEEATTDFGAVIDAINTRFDADFAPFVHTEESAKVGYWHKPERVPQIAAAREQAQARIEELIAPDRLAEAVDIYETTLCLAGKPLPLPS